MPLLKLETNVKPSADQTAALLSSLSRVVASTIGKPEKYVMVTLSHADMVMSGAGGDAAFADVRSIGGLTPGANENLSKEICHALQELLGIASDRVYLNFSDVAASNWGWNGQTFG